MEHVPIISIEVHDRLRIDASRDNWQRNHLKTIPDYVSGVVIVDQQRGRRDVAEDICGSHSDYVLTRLKSLPITTPSRPVITIGAWAGTSCTVLPPHALHADLICSRSRDVQRRIVGAVRDV